MLTLAKGHDCVRERMNTRSTIASAEADEQTL